MHVYLHVYRVFLFYLFSKFLELSFLKLEICKCDCTLYLIDLISISGSKIVNPFRFLEVFETWGPHIDGELIKEQAMTAFQKGLWQKEKPVLLGKTQ